MFVRKKQEVKNCKFCKRNGILESNVLDSNKSKISILLEELYIFIIVCTLSKFNAANSMYWFAGTNFVLAIFRFLDSIIVNYSLLEVYCRFAISPSLVEHWNCNRCNKKYTELHPIRFIIAPLYNTILMIISLFIENLL